jgi:hypothetical protein
MYEIGMNVFLYDENYRIYKDRKLVLRECFRPTIITGQTNRSWILQGKKVAKNNAVGSIQNPKGIFSKESMEDYLWETENRYSLVDKVRNCTLEQLRAINSILTQK